jgi:hypothetical protein
VATRNTLEVRLVPGDDRFTVDEPCCADDAVEWTDFVSVGDEPATGLHGRLRHTAVGVEDGAVLEDHSNVLAGLVGESSRPARTGSSVSHSGNTRSREGSVESHRVP